MQIVQAAQRQQRVARSPTHSHQVRHRPWQIQPFMIAPVLPGETLEAGLFQARVVTDPIQNPLCGWWIEYYWFYVKHRDLDARDLLVDMMLTPGTDVSSLNTAAQAETYHYAGSIDWTQLCLKRITEEYFRDEGEAWNDTLIGNLPVASIGIDHFVDSLVDETLIPEGSDPQTTPDNMETMDRYMRQYQLMAGMGMANMTYEDFLRSYGVRVPDAQEAHRPELLRYVRDWTYPSNTIDPATGAPSSACSWAIKERIDKARAFKEPGFIIGLSVTRPKTYFRNAVGSLSSFMEKAQHWLPAMFMHDAGISWIEFASGAGPAPEITQAYHADVRDLLKYGDQFYNFTDTQEMSGVELPAADGDHKYPTATMAQQLFVDDATSAFYVRQDGVVALGIESHVRDLSPVAPQT